MSAWTAEKDALLMALGRWAAQSGPHMSHEFYSAWDVVRPKASAGADIIPDAAVAAAIDQWNASSMPLTPPGEALMRSSIRAAAPILTAERDAEIERLREECSDWKRRAERQFDASQTLANELGQLRNLDIEAAAKRVKDAISEHLGEIIPAYAATAIARAVLTGKSGGG